MTIIKAFFIYLWMRMRHAKLYKVEMTKVARAYIQVNRREISIDKYLEVYGIAVKKIMANSSYPTY